jgi:hypothetical protein
VNSEEISAQRQIPQTQLDEGGHVLGTELLFPLWQNRKGSIHD